MVNRLRGAEMRIGVDFDNTLACYDVLFGELAVEQGLLGAPPAGGKRGVREAVRALPEGEMSWRRLQALAYGRHMRRATLFDGAAEALGAWRRAGADIFVASHKTRISPDDPLAVDLRRTARDWLSATGLVGGEGAPLRPSDIHFNDTRDEKLACIRRLDCDVFIDDLEEVFLEPGFPTETTAILFDPHGIGGQRSWRRVRGWREIADLELFHAAA